LDRSRKQEAENELSRMETDFSLIKSSQNVRAQDSLFQAMELRSARVKSVIHKPSNKQTSNHHHDQTSHDHQMSVVGHIRKTLMSLEKEVTTKSEKDELKELNNLLGDLSSAKTDKEREEVVTKMQTILSSFKTSESKDEKIVDSNKQKEGEKIEEKK